MSEPLTPGELEKELTSLVATVERVESEGRRSLKDIESNKVQINEFIRKSEHANEAIGVLKQQLAEQADALRISNLKNVEQDEAIDKLFRQLNDMQKRLDGTSITNMEYPNYEALREGIRVISDKLSGKGSMSYDEIQSTMTNTRFLGRVFQGVLGVIGFSGVLAIIATVFGIGGDGKITIAKLASENQNLKQQLESVEKGFTEFKTKTFEDFRSSVNTNIKTLYDRQWESLRSK